MIKMAIDPIKTLQLYLSIKTHFSSKTFDAIKGNGRFKNATGKHLDQRKDKPLIVSFSRKCSDVQQCASVLVANFAYGNEYPFDDIDKAFSHYKKFQKIRQSLTRTFTDDIIFINKYCKDTNREFNIIFETNGTPIIFSLALSGKIHIETVAILDKLLNFTPVWLSQPTLWKKEFLKIKKLQSFINIDEAKFRKILTERETNE